MNFLPDAVRRFLVKMAALAEALDPEDAAQEIILKALRGRVRIKNGQAQTYLLVAARNQARNQLRRQRRLALRCGLLIDIAEPLPYTVNYENIVDARMTLRHLLDINRNAVMELIEYTENGPQPNRQRVRVHRLRKELGRCR